MKNQETNEETAMMLEETAWRLARGNEVVRIWERLEQGRCVYQEQIRGPYPYYGPKCLGPAFYQDICGEWYCAACAPDIIESDAEHIEEELETLAEGLRRLVALGRPLPLAALRLSHPSPSMLSAPAFAPSSYAEAAE